VNEEAIARDWAAAQKKKKKPIAQQWQYTFSACQWNFLKESHVGMTMCLCLFSV
jgi:hypothetical protein